MFVLSSSTSLHPLIAGHGWFPDRKSEALLVDYVEQFDTRELGNFLTLPAAIDYMAAHGWPAMHEYYQMAVCGLPIITNNKRTADPLVSGSLLFVIFSATAAPIEG